MAARRHLRLANDRTVQTHEEGELNPGPCLQVDPVLTHRLRDPEGIGDQPAATGTGGKLVGEVSILEAHRVDQRAPDDGHGDQPDPWPFHPAPFLALRQLEGARRGLPCLLLEWSGFAKTGERPHHRQPDVVGPMERRGEPAGLPAPSHAGYEGFLIQFSRPVLHERQDGQAEPHGLVELLLHGALAPHSRGAVVGTEQQEENVTPCDLVKGDGRRTKSGTIGTAGRRARVRRWAAEVIRMSTSDDVRTTTEVPATTDQSARYKAARTRAEQVQGLLVHLLVYAVINGGLFAINALTRGAEGGWWFYWSLFGWGVGLAIHALVTFAPVFSPDWVDRRARRAVESDPR